MLPCFERIKVTTGNCYHLIPTTLKFIFPQRCSDVEKNIFAKFIFVILGKRKYNLPKEKDVVPAEIFMLLVEREKHL